VSRIPLKTLVEAGLWIAFAIVAYAYSFQFDKDIETYRFNATGWPRAVLLFIVLAALAHVYQVYRAHAPGAGPDSGESEAEEDETERRPYWRLIGMLGLPVAYAFVLEPLGFYATTPVFICLFLVLAEERRWTYLIGISLGLYALLVFVFGKLLYLSLPVGTVQVFYDFSNWLLTVIQ
jgi:hypothetical protein